MGLIVAVLGVLATLSVPFIEDALDDDKAREESAGSPTATPTAPATGTRSSAPVTTPPAPKPSDPSVVWEGELIFGDYNLDFVPPRKNTSSQAFQFLDDFFYTADSTGRFAEWPNSTAPNRAQCIAAVRKDGNHETGTVVENSYLCGRTHKGLPFRLHVVGVKTGLDAEAVTNVTIWRK
jgi:hypothetical protein